MTFGFLAWDYLAEASDISDRINNLEDYGNETIKSELSKKTDLHLFGYHHQ